MSESGHPGRRPSGHTSPGTTEAAVDAWYVQATEDGLIVAGRADDRIKAVEYTPAEGELHGVLVSDSDLGPMEIVHGSQAPTPAREHVLELHELHEQEIAALRSGCPSLTIEDVDLDAVNQTRDDCGACEAKTIHAVSIDLVSEGGGDRGFDREPYRTTTCLSCGAETEERLNNVRDEGGDPR